MTLIEKVKELRKLEAEAAQSEKKADWEDGDTELFEAGNNWKYEVRRSYVDQYGMRVYTDFGEFSTKEDADFYVASRDAAPALLDVLECFQSGDASLLRIAIGEFNKYGDEESRNIRDVLRRMQEVCRLMEAKQE